MVCRKKNRLSILLIKEEYTSFEDILDSQKKYQTFPIDEKKSFYYTQYFPRVPPWFDAFFNTKLVGIRNIKASSTQGLLLIRVNVNRTIERVFAVAFGYGRFLLKNQCIEERFGLKVVLNTIDSESIRKVEKKDISSIPKHSIEQRSKVGNRIDFGINIEQEIIKGVTGLVKEGFCDDFGRTIVGADALNLDTMHDIDDIDEFLVTCYSRYISEEYKSDFAWIDQIRSIEDKSLIDTLNAKLILKINEGDVGNKIWMAVPEVIKWENVEGFSYRYPAENLQDDIDLADFLETVSQKQKTKMNAKYLELRYIYAFDGNQNEIYKWSAYKCLYAEIEHQEKIYLLSNGNWFEIENSFLNEINTFYHAFLNKQSHLSITLPDCNVRTEGEYNKYVADTTHALLLDENNITYGGGHSSIEFCDLLTSNKEIIHVKRYGGSSVLSHLFNQGAVPCELIKTDQDFIQKVNQKLPAGHKLPNTIDAQQYKIIFVVISNDDEVLSLPFFSKIVLKNTAKRLQAFGYNVFIEKVNYTYQKDEQNQIQEN